MRLQSATWIVILLQLLNYTTASKNTNKIKKYERQQIGIDYVLNDYDEYNIHVLRQNKKPKHPYPPISKRAEQSNHFEKHALLQPRHRKQRSGKYTLAVPIELIQQSEKVGSYKPVKLLNLIHTQEQTGLAELHEPDNIYGVIQPWKKTNGWEKVTRYRDHDYSPDSEQNIHLKEQLDVSAYSQNPLTPTKNITNSSKINYSNEYYSNTNSIENTKPITYSSFSDPSYYPDLSSSPDTFYPSDSAYITESSYKSEPPEIIYPVVQSFGPFSKNSSNVHTSSYPSFFPSTGYSDKIYPPSFDSNDPLFSGTHTSGPPHQTYPIDSPEQSDKISNSRFIPGKLIPASNSHNQFPDNPTPETPLVPSSSNWPNTPNNTKDLSYPHEPPSTVNISGPDYSAGQHYSAGPSYFPDPPNPSVLTYHHNSPYSPYLPSAPDSLYSPGATSDANDSSEEYYSYENSDEHEKGTTEKNSRLNSTSNAKYSALLNSTDTLTLDSSHSDEYSSEEYSEEYTNSTHPKNKSQFFHLDPVYSIEPYSSYPSSPIEPFTNYVPDLYGSSTFRPIDFQQKSPILPIAPLDAIAIPKPKEYYSDEYYSAIHSREHSKEHTDPFDSEQNIPYPSHNRPSNPLLSSTYASEEYYSDEYSDESINGPDFESYKSSELSSFPSPKHKPRHLVGANRIYSPMYPTDYDYPYYDYPRRPLYPPKGLHSQYPPGFSLPLNELHPRYSPGPINPTNQPHYPFPYPPGEPYSSYAPGYYYPPGIMYPPDRPHRPRPSSHKYYPNQSPYLYPPYSGGPHRSYSLSRPYYSHPYPSVAYSFNPSKYRYLSGVPNRLKSLPGHQYSISGANTLYSQESLFSPHRPHHHPPELKYPPGKKQMLYPTDIYPPAENHHSYHSGPPNTPRGNHHPYHPSSVYSFHGKHHSHHPSLYYYSRGKQYLNHPGFPNSFTKKHHSYHASQPYLTRGKHKPYYPGAPYHPGGKQYPYYSGLPYLSGTKHHPYHHHSPHPVNQHKLIYSQSPSNSLYSFRGNHAYPPNYSYPTVPSNNTNQKYIPEKYWDEHYWERRHCQIGTSWTINCYDCTCLKGLKAGCTRKRECEPPPADAPKICKPYSKFSNGCKTCKCNGDGMPVCIRSLNCNEKTASTETTEPNGADIKTNTKCLKQVVPKEWVCQPRTTWSAKCHECACDDFGQAQCERIFDCIPKPFGLPSSCKPGSNWNCVGCVCDDDGEQMDEKTYLNIFG